MITTYKKGMGFNDLRSQMYNKAISKYPLARAMDVRAMKKYLSPKLGECVLGIGEGNGYFSNIILEAIGENGKYLVTDPSKPQLDNVSKRIRSSNLEIQVAGAENIQVTPESFDKIWSFGAFHHCQDQTHAMKKIYSALRKGGKVVICDVFQGGKLARHFDEVVARYCSEGHEVKFLSEEFAKSLAYLTGFDESRVRLISLPQRWVFDSEYELGDFMYNLHAMTLLPGNEQEKIAQTIEGCKRILGVRKNSSGKFELNWPMKALIATK